jgi:transposase
MKLTESESTELQRRVNARTERAESARHARLILLLADGRTWAEIRAKLDCSDSYIDRWSKRFTADRLAGLVARHAGRERYKVTERLEARVLGVWAAEHSEQIQTAPSSR